MYVMKTSRVYMQQDFFLKKKKLFSNLVGYSVMKDSNFNFNLFMSYESKNACLNFPFESA